MHCSIIFSFYFYYFSSAPTNNNSEQYRFTHFGLCGATAKNHLMHTKPKSEFSRIEVDFEWKTLALKMKKKIELMMLLPTHPRHVNHLWT